VRPYRRGVENSSEPSELLKAKLEQALELADGLDLNVVGAWILNAIEALPTADEAAQHAGRGNGP
jgi:hypothetical protein